MHWLIQVRATVLIASYSEHVWSSIFFLVNKNKTTNEQIHYAKAYQNLFKLSSLNVHGKSATFTDKLDAERKTTEANGSRLFWLKNMLLSGWRLDLTCTEEVLISSLIWPLCGPIGNLKSRWWKQFRLLHPRAVNRRASVPFHKVFWLLAK